MQVNHHCDNLSKISIIIGTHKDLETSVRYCSYISSSYSLHWNTVVVGNTMECFIMVHYLLLLFTSVEAAEEFAL